MNTSNTSPVAPGDWHYAQGQETRGPLSVQQVAALIAGNVVNGQTLVWNPKMSDWLPLMQTELRSLVGSAPPPMPTVGARTGVTMSTQTSRYAPGYRDDPDPELGLWQYFMRCVTTLYATFSGRARRKEYWGFTLFFGLISLALSVVVGGLGASFGNGGMSIGMLVLIIGLFGLLIPSIAVLVRRLHDIGRSGWWVLLCLVPYLGGIAILVMAVLPSQPTANAFGPIPPGVRVP